MSYPPPYPPQPPNRPPTGMPNFPQHPAPPVPVSQFQNGYGVAAFVLGLLSALFGWVPIVGVFAWITAPLALVFGILGLQRVGKGNANNRGLTWAGIILAGIGLLFCFIYVAALSNKTPPPSITSQPRVSSAPAGVSPTTPPVTTTPIGCPLNCPPAEVQIAGAQAGGVTDGFYEVGRDLDPGRYKTSGDSTSVMGCYYARKKDDSGDFGTIIANDIGKGPRSVTVKRGEFVEFSGGCVWNRVN